MARKIILPGQSRSTKCSKRACGRLSLHKGDCRPTLTVTKSPAGPTVVVAEKGVEVRSADVYTVQDVPVKARKARRSRKARIVTLPMAEYTRLVAAAGKRVKRSQFVVSGKPSARLA